MNDKAKFLLLVWCGWLLGGCTLTPAEQSAKNTRSTVLIEHSGRHLAGFIVGQDRILTHKTVFKGTDPEVTFLNGETNPGRVIRRDDERGLVVVEVFVPRTYPIASPACRRPSSGDAVTVVEHPHSARWATISGVLPGQGLIADQYHSLGFTLGEDIFGAPVFDEKGRAIGMVQAILAKKRHGSTATGREAYEKEGIGLMRHAREFCVDVKVAVIPRQ